MSQNCCQPSAIRGQGPQITINDVTSAPCDKQTWVEALRLCNLRSRQCLFQTFHTNCSLNFAVSCIPFVLIRCIIEFKHRGIVSCKCNYETFFGRASARLPRAIRANIWKSAESPTTSSPAQMSIIAAAKKHQTSTFHIKNRRVNLAGLNHPNGNQVWQLSPEPMQRLF